MGCAPSSAAVHPPDVNGNVQNGKRHSTPQANDPPQTDAEAGVVPITESPQKDTKPVEQQTEDVEEPMQPASKPDEPVSKSDKPTTPEESTSKSDEPASKPAEPASEPEEPTSKPGDQPAFKLDDEPASKLDDESAGKPTEPVDEPDKSAEESTHEKPAPVYTEESLQKFLSLESKLSSLAKKNIVGEYQTQHKWLVSLYGTLQAAQKKVEALKQQTAKEYQDVAYMQHPNVRAMFSNIYQLQSQLAKEQQEYMDALNRQEVAEKELKGIQQEYNALYAKVENLWKEYQELETLRQEQEKRLDEIFGGKYGSELEEQLEVETDLLTERKEMISATRSWWCNAKVLMRHAVDQLRFSTRRWAQINSVSQTFIQARYSMVAETRNYLIAAAQNITNAHRYLGNVDIPYCNSEDVKVLNSAIASIFNDVMSSGLYRQALQTYNTLATKADTLLQWIDLVLEKTINKDLGEVLPECNAKMAELKRERLRLIHVKLRELQGQDVACDDIPEEVVDVEPVPEPVGEAQSDTHIAEPDAVSLKKEVENEDDVAPLPTTEETTEQPSEAPSDEPTGTETAGTAAESETTETSVEPKPLTELAPAPAQDILFGNIEELKTKYEQQVAEFFNAQDVNKARVDQALQEKLRARRSRRQKVELQELETSELAKGVTQELVLS